MLDPQITIPDLSDITALRQHLHRHPELSGNEYKTSQTLRAFLSRYQPAEIIDEVAETGFALVFSSSQNQDGPTILFRAELDALPITEQCALPYASTQQGISHKCGHDGHMAILVGLASLLHSHPLSAGRVVLLFQPAEETGAGAWAMLQDERLTALHPDYVYALHNLPGQPLGQVLLRDHAFAAASVGMRIELFGRESHAAEPENGLNPGEAMSELIQALNHLVRAPDRYKGLALLTVVHARLGEVAFGTNPGYATVMATLRAFEQQDLDLLKGLATEAVELLALKYGLRYTLDWVEEFPATVNHATALRFVEQACTLVGITAHNLEKPMRWSEDFGHFTARYSGALFGLGSGIDQPQLHHADYDFPDALIPVGANLFYRIAQSITKENDPHVA
jgi:amidohydrolase